MNELQSISPVSFCYFKYKTNISTNEQKNTQAYTFRNTGTLLRLLTFQLKGGPSTKQIMNTNRDVIKYC